MDTEKLTEYADYLLQCAMYKVNNLSDAGDLVQETFLAALTAMEKGERENAPFRPDNLKKWLVKVLDRKYYDILRRKYRRLTVSIDLVQELADENDIAETLEKTEEAEKIRRCLGRLTENYRQVMVQYYVYGKSVKAISSELGISESTVKNRLCTGRQHIGKDYAMEKYVRQSYEPEILHVGSSGRCGSDGSPSGLVGDGKIEMNLLILAYDKPLTVPELADAIGISTTYIEPVVDKLVRGELMKKVSNKVYTDFIICTEEDRKKHLEQQITLADRLYADIGEVLGRWMGELEKTDVYGRQRPEAGRKLRSLFAVRAMSLATCSIRDRVCGGQEPFENYPDRPLGGKWYALGSRYPVGYDYASSPYAPYNISGEVRLHDHDCCGLDELAVFEYDTDEKLFGRTHRAYRDCRAEDIYKMLYCVYSGKEEYLSVIDKRCLENTDRFIAMKYLDRDGSGKLICEIPVLFPEEEKEFSRLCGMCHREIAEKFDGDIAELMKDPVKLPSHLRSVPEWQRYMSCCDSFSAAVLYKIKRAGQLFGEKDSPAPPIMLMIREPER